MWPPCINALSPLPYELKPGVPKFLKKAFNDAGISDDSIFIPIRPVAILGKCSSAAYLDCPNIPEHHLENAELNYDDPAEYFADTGRYYWFDFDVVGSDGEALPLRMVFNIGDGDCNDGFWGAVWERNTEELVANILSTGDCETTIEVVETYSDRYECQDWVPTTFERGSDSDFDWESIPVGKFKYAHDRQLEKFIGLAIQICCLYRYKNSYTKLGYDL